MEIEKIMAQAISAIGKIMAQAILEVPQCCEDLQLILNQSRSWVP